MTVAAGELQELHKLLLELHDVEEQLRKGPVRITAKERNTKKKEDALEAAREAHQESRKLADQKSLDLQSGENRINDFKGKLNSASTNREFDTIKGQIASETEANGVLEDEILAALDAVDAAAQGIVDAEEDLKKAKDDEQQARADFESRAAELQTQAVDLQTRIKEAEGVLSGQNKEQYRRVVGQKGADALAAVSDGICSGCHVGLTAQNKIRLNTGDILFCKQCGSLLYSTDS